MKQPILTAREKQVLALLKQAKADKEIAQELNITTSTVQNHVAQLLKKHHVHTRRAFLMTQKSG